MQKLNVAKRGPLVTFYIKHYGMVVLQFVLSCPPCVCLVAAGKSLELSTLVLLEKLSPSVCFCFIELSTFDNRELWSTCTCVCSSFTTAGYVMYDAAHFLVKNADATNPDTVELFHSSNVEIVKGLFAEEAELLAITQQGEMQTVAGFPSGAVSLA